MNDKVIHISEKIFNISVLQAKKPILVDFWAEWCGPCKIIAPILDEIAHQYGDRLSIVKLNIDENPAIAPRFSVRSIPTLLLFKKGIVTATKIGALSKTQLEEFLNSNL
ncbi:thioredoxin TrxA [Candidatus Profftia sp. (ex Adelges kitamiensis)]|uniref:thioredoxin TrxA n=1 Tax=Candidatus Profftia sp. (ex Adelges kitamiensis) TaxID=2864218 RepID=UPI001CE33DC6|nr:thioredoxin TrxA [Candidatus Profftia sp. (ex Adelges kitamiensis)]